MVLLLYCTVAGFNTSVTWEFLAINRTIYPLLVWMFMCDLLVISLNSSRILGDYNSCLGYGEFSCCKQKKNNIQVKGLQYFIKCHDTNCLSPTKQTLEELDNSSLKHWKWWMFISNKERYMGIVLVVVFISIVTEASD